MIYQADLSVCRLKVPLLASLVYPRVCPRDRSWDHSYSLYISTGLIEMFQMQISTFMPMIL
uniref:Uncharacterized protein n=1 Tax=Anguilla anguilla TaxID=7936 RepID=A0A0E9UKW4_ANGAN